jgi:hypothetical protein
MAQNIIDSINSFQTFKYDETAKRIVNLRDGFETDVDEFLAIQHILDNNNIIHKFEGNFNIKVINNAK